MVDDNKLITRDMADDTASLSLRLSLSMTGDPQMSSEDDSDEARAKALSLKISHNSIFDSEDFEALKSCLVTIEDTEFVIECCCQTALPTANSALELLNFAREILKQKMSILNGSHATTNGHTNGHSYDKTTHEELVNKVQSQLHRLSTYEIVCGRDKFCQAEWQSFMKADLCQGLLLLLASGQLARARLIWQRHEEELCQIVSSDTHLFSLITSVSASVSSRDLAYWIVQDVLPLVVRQHSSLLPSICCWLVERARSLETTEQAGWPQNALTLCETVLSCGCGNSSDSDISIATPKQFATWSCSLVPRDSADSNGKVQSSVEVFAELRALASRLHELVDLHSTYKCTLTLEQFEQETAETVVFQMLNRVEHTDIAAAIRTTVRPYMAERGFHEDKVLALYIEDLVQRCAKQATVSQWEARAVVVINCITDAELQCQALLTVMSYASIPWIAELNTLINDVSKLDHPCVVTVREKCRLVDLQQLLVSYNLRHLAMNIIEATVESVVKYIITQDRPTAMADALAVVDAFYSLQSSVAYIFRLHFLISRDRLDECMTLLQSLPITVAVGCTYKITSSTLSLLRDPPVGDNLSLRALYLKASCSILTWIVELNTGDALEYSMLLQDFKRIAALQFEFGEIVSRDSYIAAEERTAILFRHIADFLSESHQSKHTSADSDKNPCRKNNKTLICKLYRLAELLLVDRADFESAFVSACLKADRINYAIEVLTTSVRHLCDAKSAALCYRTVVDLCSTLSTGHTDGQKLSALVSDMFALAKAALTNCDKALLSQCASLCRLLQLTSRVLEQCETGRYLASVAQGRPQDGARKDHLQQWSFDVMFSEDGSVLDSATVLPLTFTYIAACIDAQGQGKTEGLVTSLKRVQAATVSLIVYLRQNLQLQLAIDYITASTLLYLEKVGESNETALQSIQDMVLELLVKMVNQTHVDNRMAVGYLAMLTQTRAYECLKKLRDTVGHSSKKALVLSKIGRDLAAIFKDTNTEHVCRELATNAEWSHRLAKLKISIKTSVKSMDVIAANALIADIAKHPEGGLDVVMELADVISMDVDDALTVYLRTLLLTPGVERTSKRTSEQRWFEVQKVARDAVQRMKRRSRRLRCLDQIVDEFDMYDYEKLRFVLELMQQYSDDAKIGKSLQLLDCLMLYKRVALPEEYEIGYRTASDSNAQLSAGGNQLATSSRERLPFHALMHGDALKIASGELNVSTIDKWLPIACILELPGDQVYALAMKNAVDKYAASMKQESAISQPLVHWSISDHCLKLIGQVKAILIRIQHVDAAIAGAKYVIRHMPRGGEKVLATQLCVMFVKKCLEGVKSDKEREKYTAELSSLSLAYARLATEQLLHASRLGESTYTSLCAKPTQLISLLYEHPSVVSQLSSGPDIHLLVKKIAELHNVNLAHTQYSLIDSWLTCRSRTDVDLSMTQVFNASVMDATLLGDNEENGEDENNLRRIIAVLRHDPSEEKLLYVANIAFQTGPGNISSSLQARALRCLLAVGEGHVLEKLARGLTLTQIGERLVHLLYAAELEQLSINITVESLIKYNKENLAKGIWRDHSDKSRAVRLVANLCLDFGVYDMMLWSNVLHRLIAVGLQRQVRYCLARLISSRHLMAAATLQQLWRDVLLSPLNTYVPPLSDAQLENCMQTYAMLFRYPLLVDLDLQVFAKQFLRVEMFACALGCHLLLSDSVTINLDHDVHSLLRQINQWTEKGYLVPLADAIKRYVAKRIDQQQNVNTSDGVHLNGSKLASSNTLEPSFAGGDFDQSLLNNSERSSLSDLIDDSFA